MKSRKLSLDVYIHRTNRRDSMPFVLEIDGDKFFAKSYHHAICLLLEIVTRDEL